MISVCRRTVFVVSRIGRGDFFQQFSVCLLPDSIDRCPDHWSCAQFSIFRHVHPTDSGRMTERLPGRPRNGRVRRSGYMALGIPRCTRDPSGHLERCSRPYETAESRPIYRGGSLLTTLACGEIARTATILILL